ncbi:hypothetical protein J1N09_06315 [Aureitalea sp. L0-47]|uniref:hypothetical protein n=1 Tax=Aureitalea sp. L0-47 TaxID=2816962 RepID=UPI00223842C5|nr:hypothetical protein [Aureitalea sp. L0-47]MCW5519443.1 hypothetical protein [Aureitalea sp. L0-47]
MRTLITIFALGFAFLAYAQDPDPLTRYELEDVVVTANSAYLATVQDENTPAVARMLQKQAATYDVRSNKEFDKNVADYFEMVFKNNSGNIDAYYDNKGRIVAASEFFKDVQLPAKVRDEVFKGNDEWKMTSNRYSSSYNDTDLVRRTYKIKLEKGDHKKDVVIHFHK